jgi:hypothetical protein
MLNNLIKKLKQVKDECQSKGERHPICFVFLIVKLAIIPRKLGEREMENLAKINPKELRHIFKLNQEFTLSYSTTEGQQWLAHHWHKIFVLAEILPMETLYIKAIERFLLIQN